MKITIEYYRNKYTIETPSDDEPCDVVIDTLMKGLVQCGYHTDTIMECMYEVLTEWGWYDE
jgi:hypothetical protein